MWFLKKTKTAFYYDLQIWVYKAESLSTMKPVLRVYRLTAIQLRFETMRKNLIFGVRNFQSL